MTPEDARRTIEEDIARKFHSVIGQPESPGDQLSVAIGAVESVTGGRVVDAYVDGDAICYEWVRDDYPEDEE